MNIYKDLKNNWVLIILFLVSFLTIIPFFNQGFFLIHDNTQIQRVFEMKQSLADGMLPVRWVSDLGYGYGYPIFNFYAPLPYYIGAFISFFGFNALISTKIMIAASVFGASFTMYLLAKEFWGRYGGLMSAVLYIFAPYHALNTYVRGDVGEIYAYSFIPLVFYGLWKYYGENKSKYLAIGSLAYSAVILSHNLSALMISPFILSVTLILFIKKRKPQLFLIPLFGILISSFYFIPALLEMKYTNVIKIIKDEINYKDHFVCIPQLWNSEWMYGGSVSGCVDGLSFRLGKIHVIASVISFFISFLIVKKQRTAFWIILLSSVGLVFSLFLMTEYSELIWSLTPFMNYFQFPWRFLLIASFLSSFVAGFSVYFIFNYLNLKYKKIILIYCLLVLVFITVFLYLKLFQPIEYINKTSSEFTDKKTLNWETSKISDEYMPAEFKSPKSEGEIISEKISAEGLMVSGMRQKTNYLSANLFAPNETKAVVHIASFPAWKYYINDEKIVSNEVSSGVEINIPKGKSALLVIFQQTKIEVVSNVLSLLGVIFLVTAIIYPNFKKHEKIS